ncbi:hypothetical protein GQ457_03G015930 [Hibiscus cannabinus]
MNSLFFSSPYLVPKYFFRKADWKNSQRYEEFEASSSLNTLKEAFQVYGEVLDVYVAFNNQRRRFKKTSFAFVRFKSDEEARRAIESGSGRLMDGFCISVFIAWSNKDKQDSIKFGKVLRGRIVFPNESFFLRVGSRWGKVLRIDSDTSDRNRYCLKVKVEEFEDDQRFIDGESLFDLSCHEIIANNASIHVSCNNEDKVVGPNSEYRLSCGSMEVAGGSQSPLGQRHLVDVPVNIVEDSPIRVVGVGVGQVFSTNVVGRETYFESLSNESRLQEMLVENVVELARQASPLQAQQ